MFKSKSLQYVSYNLHEKFVKVNNILSIRKNNSNKVTTNPFIIFIELSPGFIKA